MVQNTKEAVYHWGDPGYAEGDHGPVTPEMAFQDLLSFAQQEWGGAADEFYTGALTVAFWPGGAYQALPETIPGRIRTTYEHFAFWYKKNQTTEDPGTALVDPVAFGQVRIFMKFVEENNLAKTSSALLDYCRGAYFMAYFFHGIPGSLPDREAVDGLADLMKGSL